MVDRRRVKGQPDSQYEARVAVDGLDYDSRGPNPMPAVMRLTTTTRPDHPKHRVGRNNLVTPSYTRSPLCL